MSVALVEAETRVAPERATSIMVRGRGLRRALVAAVRAGRSPQRIAAQAGVRTSGVTDLLDGCTFATTSLSEKLERVLTVEEKLLVTDARPGHVPIAVLRPLLDAAIDQHGIETTATICGVSRRRLCAIRGGQARTVHLSTADRLVISLDSPMRWYQDRALRPWYFATVATV